jgi:hypothetical protein
MKNPGPKPETLSPSSAVSRRLAGCGKEVTHQEETPEGWQK